MCEIRNKLISVALEWQEKYGVAPSITSALSEYDAAMIVGCTEEQYSKYMQVRTAVSRDVDFVHEGKRYQVKGSRPSGKPGSPVTKVTQAKNYNWDHLIWILYNKEYEIQEAWLWEKDKYEEMFSGSKRISPKDMRQGTRIFPN